MEKMLLVTSIFFLFHYVFNSFNNKNHFSNCCCCCCCCCCCSMVSNTVFQQYFSYIVAFSAPIHTFLEFFQQVLRTIFFPSHCLLSHITIVDTMDSSEREMNPVAMAIINLQKEYWPSCRANQQPPVLKFAKLPTHFGYI